MVDVYQVPSWFYGYDLLLEVIFFLVTLFVAVYAFRLYRLAGEKQLQYLGIGFSCFSFAYLIQSLVNLRLFSRFHVPLSSDFGVVNIGVLNNFGIFVHILFFLAGLLTLYYMALEVKDPRQFTFSVVLILVLLLFTRYKLLVFYLISMVLFLILFSRYYVHHKKNGASQHMAVAFFLLMLANLLFQFSIVYELGYALGHFLELFAYLVIFSNLVRVIRMSNSLYRPDPKVYPSVMKP